MGKMRSSVTFCQPRAAVPEMSQIKPWSRPHCHTSKVEIRPRLQLVRLPAGLCACDLAAALCLRSHSFDRAARLLLLLTSMKDALQAVLRRQGDVVMDTRHHQSVAAASWLNDRSGRQRQYSIDRVLFAIIYRESAGTVVLPLPEGSRQIYIYIHSLHMTLLQVLHYSEAAEEGASPDERPSGGPEGLDSAVGAAEKVAAAAKSAGGNGVSGVSEPKRRSARLNAENES